jgi:RimJ/RimL family protein N-acetyltransferase
VIFTTGASDTASWSEPLQLQGYGLTLAPLGLDDAADFLAALGSPEESAAVLAHLTYSPPVDIEAATKIITAAVDDHDRLAYAQRLTDTGELVGTTSYYEINPALAALAIGHPGWPAGTGGPSSTPPPS